MALTWNWDVKDEPAIRICRIRLKKISKEEQKGILRDGLNLQEIAKVIGISLNGAAPLYAASKDPAVGQQTMAQLHFYIKSLRKPNETVSIYYSVTREKERAL